MRTDSSPFVLSVFRILLAFSWVGANALAEEPFPEPYDSQELTVTLSTPQEALAAIQAPEGFRVTLFASEPEVRQPIAITTDTRGRLWVAENYTYAERTMAIDPNLRDRVIILEDTDHDGAADKRTVFWDQAVQLTSVEVGFGGVFVMCPPQLLFIPDRNRDDIPDGPPIVLLDGFDLGTANRHNFANGLKWGPDGWLYGRNGISNVGHVGKPGTLSENRVETPPGIWRYHPVDGTFEIVCEGTTNPWGHDWDERGELFFINTVIGHLWHGIPGAHYKRMFGSHPNPFLYELIDQTADHFHWDTTEAWNEAKKGLSESSSSAGGGHAHSGMLIYLGGNWPEKYKGGVLALNMHGRRMNHDRIERQGATFVGKHEPDLWFSLDPWFRGVELIYGNDGAVYVADWSDIGECHEHDGVHRHSGRIFKTTFGPPKKPEVADVSQLTDEALVELQRHENEWYARQAGRVLQERAAAGADRSQSHLALARLFFDRAAPIHVRLRAAWRLHATEGDRLPEDRLLSLLSESDESLRVWCLRLLAERTCQSDTSRPRQGLSRETIAAITRHVRAEKSGLVLTYAASLLQRLPIEQRSDLAKAISSHGEFSSDRLLAPMIWHGVEPLVSTNPNAAMEIAISSQIPRLSRHIARRMAHDIAKDLEPTDRLLRLAIGLQGDHSAPARSEILTGLSLALRGRRKVAAPASWSDFAAMIQRGGSESDKLLATEIGAVFGDGRAVDDLIAFVLDKSNDIESRQSAIRAIVDARAPVAPSLLQSLFDQHDLAPEAIRGLASFDDPSTPNLLVKAYGSLYPPGKEATIATMTSRPRYAAVLLKSIAEGLIDLGQVSVFQIRQMQSYPDDEIQRLLGELWPNLRPIAEGKRDRIQSLRTALKTSLTGTTSLEAGKAVWQKSCAKCHTFRGEGGKIGPDITGSQRQNLDYLLENIVDPSATLLPAYKMNVVTLHDGRVLRGVVVTKDDTSLELQTPTDKVVLQRTDIEEIAESRDSLMPDGLLDVLNENDVRDLFAYVMDDVLRTSR